MAVPSLKRSDNGTVDSKSVGLNFTEVRIRNRIVINVGVIGFYDDGTKLDNLLHICSISPEYF